MKKIQYISFNKTARHYIVSGVTHSSFGDLLVFDNFDLNIIDLNSSNIWQTYSREFDSLICENDLKTTGEMIKISCKSAVLVLFPQNIVFQSLYYSGTSGSKPIKDKLNNVSFLISSYLLSSQTNKLFLSYGKDTLDLGSSSLEADFSFKSSHNALLKSTSGNSILATQLSQNIFFTTCHIKSTNELILFIKLLKIFEEQTTCPNWVNEYHFFNDEDLVQSKNKTLAQVLKLNNDLAKIDDDISKNLSYKKALYTNSQELVDVVFRILNELLDVDLSNFEDEKKEDFLFELNGYSFIGEIKGVTSNVRDDHIAQAEKHRTSYISKQIDLGNEIPREKTKAILIVNRLRTKPLNEREEIHSNQIEYAKKNDVLIISTEELLNILSSFKKGDIKREEIVNILINQSNIGVYKFNK